MKLLKQYPFFLLLFVLFFCLHGAVENFGHISIKETALIGLSILFQCSLFFIFIFIFIRKFILTSFIALFTGGFYFFFGVFQDKLRFSSSLAFLGRYSVLISIFFTMIFALFFLLKKKQSSWPEILLFLNILFLIYTGYDLFLLLLLNNQKQIKVSTINFDYTKVVKKPNVYFLLFDGYPSVKVMKDSFDFDNFGFTNFLSKNSFTSLPISSNYDMTQFSMSSTLNMNYINPLYNLSHTTQQEYQKRQKEISNATVFEIFENMGYQLENNSIFDIHNLPGTSSENNFLLTNGILLTDKIFINRLNKDMGRIVPQSVVKWMPFLQRNSIFKDMVNNNNIEKVLLKKNNLHNPKPIFNYAHFIMPHAPHYYDSVGNFNNSPLLINKSDDQIKNEFVSYLKYTNSVMEKVVLHLIKQDSNAIVILLSDHGYRAFKNNNTVLPNKLSSLENIGAVHFPNNNYGNIPDTITNVNFFRYLFNTQFYQNFTFVKDSTFQ